MNTWPAITEKLVSLFPLLMSILAETVNAAWVDLYNAGFGETGFDREFEEVSVILR